MIRDILEVMFTTIYGWFIIAVIAFIIWMSWPRSNPEQAIRVLELQGFTEVETTGWRMFGCGKDDQYVTGFEANAPSGDAVSGVVCDGWFKGATIRID